MKKRLILGVPMLFAILPLSWLVAFSDAAVADSKPAASPSPFEIDERAHRVIRRDATGCIEWSTPLDGYLGGVRPPHLLSDDERVYLTHADGVTALDAKTGKLVWQSKGANKRMCLSKDLLLATQCGQSESINAHGRWLIARQVDTGAEAFRVRLPSDDYFDPLPIREVADLFLVQVRWAKDSALLIDRKGQVQLQFDKLIVDGIRLDDATVFLTSQDVMRVEQDRTIRWIYPWEKGEVPAAGGLLKLSGGDVVAYLYCQIADSGVQLVRLNHRKRTVAEEL